MANPQTFDAHWCGCLIPFLLHCSIIPFKQVSSTGSLACTKDGTPQQQWRSNNPHTGHTRLNSRTKKFPCGRRDGVDNTDFSLLGLNFKIVNFWKPKGMMTHFWGNPNFQSSSKFPMWELAHFQLVRAAGYPLHSRPTTLICWLTSSETIVARRSLGCAHICSWSLGLVRSEHKQIKRKLPCPLCFFHNLVLGLNKHWLLGCARGKKCAFSLCSHQPAVVGLSARSLEAYQSKPHTIKLTTEEANAVFM